MNFNTAQNTLFADGTIVPNAEKVTYLGSVLSKTHNIRQEVANKKAQAFYVWKKLDIFWKKANCPPRFKLIVYDAVIRSKLVYGLECVHLPKTAINVLNTFQLKGLRKILNLKTTFITRGNTNKKVFEEANKIRFPPPPPNTNGIAPRNPRPNQHSNSIRSFEQYIKDKQTSLLGHLIRADPEDPTRKAAFSGNSNTPCTHVNRRVGRPRQHLIPQTYERLWSDTPGNIPSQYKNNLDNNIQEVANKAINRRPPFAPPPGLPPPAGGPLGGPPRPRPPRVAPGLPFVPPPFVPPPPFPQ